MVATGVVVTFKIFIIPVAGSSLNSSFFGFVLGLTRRSCN
jgi:hypothetical protein